MFDAVSMGWFFFQEKLPICGSILQAGTCQILRFAENPRWSRVWQYLNGQQELFPLCSFNMTSDLVVTFYNITFI